MRDEKETLILSSGTGCIYKEHLTDSPCRKLCDKGETMCPYHRMLSAVTTCETEPGRKCATPRGYRD